MDASTTLRQPTIKTTTWKNVIHEYYDQNFIEIQPLKNGFRFITLNPQKMSFDLPPNHYSLGEKIINKTAKVNGSDRVTDFSLIIENKFLNQKPLFFTWDFELKQFITIKTEKEI